MMTAPKTHRLTLNLSVAELEATLPLLIANGLDFSVAVRQQRPMPTSEITGELIDPPPIPLRPANGAAKAVVEDLISEEPLEETPSGKRRRTWHRSIEPKIADGKIKETRDRTIEELTKKYRRAPVFTQYSGVRTLMILDELIGQHRGGVMRKHLTTAWALTDFSPATLGYTITALKREGMIVQHADKSYALTDDGRRELFYHKGTFKK